MSRLYAGGRGGGGWGLGKGEGTGWGGIGGRTGHPQRFSDDRDGLPGPARPPVGEGFAHPGDVFVEASLRDEHRSNQAQCDIPCQSCAAAPICSSRPIAPATATTSITLTMPADFRCCWRPAVTIERAIEPSDRGAHHRRRMRQPPPQPIGVADQRVERQRRDHDEKRAARDQHLNGPRARVPRPGDRARRPASVRRRP